MPVCRSCGRLNPADVASCEKCGAPMSNAPPAPQADPEGELLNRLQKLLAAGEKIEAIKVYREYAGVGLAEAKAFVDSLTLGPARPAMVDDDIESKLLDCLRAGNKINAIKLYREQTGVGLKEAKDYVEAFAVQHGMPMGSGCGKAAAMLLVAAAVGIATLSAAVLLAG